MRQPSLWRRWPLLGPPIFALLVAPGCGSREEIQSYTVPKDVEPPAAEPAADVAEPADVGEPTDRMLAAIVPVGNQAWFFKVVGPVAAVDQREEEIDEFFASIRLGDDGRPTWELPADDWTQEEGSGMRAATIRIPADGDPLELSVIPAMGSVLSNVNRWRGQMKLPPVGEAELNEFTRQLQAGDVTITVVDLRGRFDAGPMMGPFMRGAQGRPGAGPQLPPGHPPIDNLENQTPSGAPDGDR